MLPHTVTQYLATALPGAMLGVLLYAIAYPLRRRRLERLGLRSYASREWLMLLFLSYCGAMAMLTLTPPTFHLLAALRGEWLTPFFSTGEFNLRLFSNQYYSVGLTVGNVILFMPFTFFAAVLWRNYRWYHALVTALCITVCIECWQHFVGRLSELDDLVLNTLGGILGWLFYLALGKPALHCEEK